MSGAFVEMPNGAGDGNQLCLSDIEAFLVGVLLTIPKATTENENTLPYSIRCTSLQRQFFQAASDIRSPSLSRMDVVNCRNTIRNGKNVIRLKGAEPPFQTVAQIGTFFASIGDHLNAVFYLEAIEAKLKATAWKN